MIVLIRDSNGHNVFEFDEKGQGNKENIAFLKEYIVKNNKDEELTSRGFYNKVCIDSLIIHMLHVKVSNKKEAQYKSKIFVSAIQSYNNYFKLQEDIYNNVFYSSYHNTKNIAHSIKGKIEKLVNFSSVLFGSDKVAYIADVISSNPIEAAREILSLYKSLEQMQFEYDIIDFLKPSSKLNDKDFSSNKFHSLIVQAFYIYESDYLKKNITVSICECQKYIYCNFFSVRSAFVLLFENCLKYTKDDTSIDLEFIETPMNYRMNISMISIYNSDADIQNMFLPGIRGAQSEKYATGSGYGLYIVKKLLQLNNLDITFNRISDSRINHNGYIFCNNLFSVQIPKYRISNTKAF